MTSSDGDSGMALELSRALEAGLRFGAWGFSYGILKGGGSKTGLGFAV